jgi:hypothetical protein
MRYEGSLSDYRTEVNAMMQRTAEFSSEIVDAEVISTVNKILDWLEDKAGQEFALHEIADGIGDETRGLRTFHKMGPLMGGRSMAEVFFKVETPDGRTFLLDDVYKASEGETYVAPDTKEILASSRQELETKCYAFFRIADFTVEPKLSI